MTWKQLKETPGIPDDAVLAIPGSDHSYRFAVVELTTAMRYRGPGPYRDLQLVEDHGDDYNDPGGKRVKVLLFQ
jgi:hypothetical protein